MQKLFYFILIVFHSNFLDAQIPRLEVLDTFGQNQLIEQKINPDKNYLISFWASWCFLCLREFTAWEDYTAAWTTDYNVDILAISLDDTSKYEYTKQLWLNKEWKGELLFAESDSATTAFGFLSIPQVYLYNKSGELIYEHSGFSQGDEVELNQVIMSSFGSSSTKSEDKYEQFEILQNGNQIQISTSQPLRGTTLNVFSLDGKRVLNANFDSFTDIHSFSIENIKRNQLYIFELIGEKFRKSQLFFVQN